MTLTTGQDEQVTEFRVGTVNDLLLAAKGGTTDSAADVKRFKSLALAGGVSSAVLALALVVVLITGTGSKSSSKSASTTATTAPLATPAGFNAPTLTLQPAQANGLHQGDHVILSGPNRDGTGSITIPGCLLLGLTETKNTPANKNLPATVTITATIGVPQDRFQDFGNMDQRYRTIAVQGGTAPTAPAATQPPATQPATTPPSS